MKYSKDFNKGIGFAHVGADAYKVSDVWKLGPHIFKCDGNLIFRINFLRTKKEHIILSPLYELRKSSTAAPDKLG